jgi:large subunit ribosomal protein L17e
MPSLFLAYLSSNCHVELWATEKEDNVKKEADKKQVVRRTRK